MLYSKMKIWATAFLLMRFIQHLNCRYWPHAQINILLTEADRRDLFVRPLFVSLVTHRHQSSLRRPSQMFLFTSRRKMPQYFSLSRRKYWRDRVTPLRLQLITEMTLQSFAGCFSVCVCLYSVGGGGGVWYVQTVLSELLLLGDMKTF